MTTIEKLRTAFISAYRDYCKEWQRIYDEEVKNVSYADRVALTTDAGQRYLEAKLKYEEHRSLLKSDAPGNE